MPPVLSSDSWKGSLLALSGSMLGAARRVLARTREYGQTPPHDCSARNQDKLRAMRERKGFLVTLRLRLIPLVPFGVFNYAAGAVEGRVSCLPRRNGGSASSRTPLAAVFAGERVAAGFSGGGRSAHLVAAAVVLALIGVSFLPTAIRKLRER
jgi:hypothetical protein